MNTPIQNQESIEPPTAPQVNENMNAHKKVSLLLILGIALLLIAVAGGAYYVGTMRETAENSEQTLVLPSPTQSASELYPSESSPTDALGVTTWSFTTSNNDMYMKQTTHIVSDKVNYPNGKEQTITYVYSQDEYYDPKKIESLDVNNYAWVEILKEPIKDSANSVSILVSDGLLSFKKIPDTNNFLFAIELNRSASNSMTGPWGPYQNMRTLYLYTQNQGKAELKKIASFENNKKSYSFPKIHAFSLGGRYVSIHLFGCWGCGGHTPETYLVDLQTLKTLNIGRTSYFSWKQDGNYEYKDYVEIECAEPGPGPCSQDPNSLPLKTGNI